MTHVPNPGSTQTGSNPPGDKDAGSGTPPGDGTHVNTTTVNNQHNYFHPAGTKEEPLSDLPEDLPKLPPGFHPFRDPNHKRLLQTLAERRILLLLSYREKAAYAAGHAIVSDQSFTGMKKRALFPTRRRDKERSDFELMNLTQDTFLGKEPQVLLIEIDSKCTFLDSVVDSPHGTMGSVCDKLERHGSYMVLSLDEGLVESEEVAEKLSRFSAHTISHLRYLLADVYAERAEDFETRLLAALGPLSTPAARREHYQRIADQLAQGATVFEIFLEKLEAAMHLPPEARVERQVQPSIVFRNDSEVHRAAAFVAAYFPELNQKDFDRFVRLLLADSSTTTEVTHPGFRRDGKAITVRTEKVERWADRWAREGDKVFGECHLRTVVSGNGAWVVDFREPYLRDALRQYLQEHQPWYLRRQCQRLQTSGILFAPDLSPKAVDGLVQLFVERAIADPAGFGSIWLLDLVLSARAALSDGPAPETPDETLAWLAEKLAQVHLRALFHERLAALIRELLDQPFLRPVVEEFFQHLIASRQHDALLDVILDLAQRLRFAPHFDPLFWMRRLLNEGSEAVRGRTAIRLVGLARDSRLRIYEFLAAIRKWLPENGQPISSPSAGFALEFPFFYCAEMARSVTPGVWPSQHPLFYALPDDPAKAREEIAGLIEWILDARGAALEEADASSPLATAESVRIGHVADLIEHWAWVLEGGTEDGPPEGRALFDVIVEELDSRLSVRERSWLQRTWKQRQEEQLREAAVHAKDSFERGVLIARKTKLEQLRVRFTNLPKP